MSDRIESIVKYYGDIKNIAENMGLTVEILNENYAIIVLSSEERAVLSANPQIEHIEEQKILNFLNNPATTASCITYVQQDCYNLTGQGVLLAVLDSGIDYSHNDFRNDNGTTRIISIWDQNTTGNPPAGFTIGNEYNQEEINAALNGIKKCNIPAKDSIGHGTAVTGIAAGNGRASNGKYAGAAPEASLLIVQLAQGTNAYNTSDTSVMRGIKYALDKAIELNMPLVINICYGTNQGLHDGSSLFEQYIDSMAERWKTSIVIPTGNEGASGKHFRGELSTGSSIDAQFKIQSRLEKISIIMLKSFVDEFEMQIEDSSGRVSPPFNLINDHTVTMGNVEIIVSVVQPSPYNGNESITLIFSDKSGKTLESTIWTIRLNGISVVSGNINMWLPVTEVSGANTAFLAPEANVSLTIPSTVPNAISVGGYNSTTNRLAEFSGRGFTISNVIKPEICAPAVDVVSTAIGGGYSKYTGTSFAGSITAGACALMMQWGIINGNDIFMYRRRLKSFLEYGAVRHASNIEYPNPNWGYGALCLKNSLDYASTFPSITYSDIDYTLPSVTAHSNDVLQD